MKTVRKTACGIAGKYFPGNFTQIAVSVIILTVLADCLPTACRPPASRSRSANHIHSTQLIFVAKSFNMANAKSLKPPHFEMKGRKEKWTGQWKDLSKGRNTFRKC